MKTKGTTVKAIQNFVKGNFPDRYDEWLNSLPAKSKEIMTGAILATDWYPLKEGVVLPTRQLKMFFAENSLKAAWEAGRYSASTTLTGVYKIFIQMANPHYGIKRAAKATATYYENAVVESKNTGATSSEVYIIKFEDLDRMIEQRIGGWIERALELSGCENVKIRISKSLTRGDERTTFVISWD